MPEDLAARYVRAVIAFNDGDVATFLELVSPNVVYHVHGHNRISGVYEGPEAFGAVLRQAVELTGGTISADQVAVLSDDTTWVMTWGVLTGTRNGRDLDAPHVWIYRFDEEGRLVEGHSIPADQHVVDQFWS